MTDETIRRVLRPLMVVEATDLLADAMTLQRRAERLADFIARHHTRQLPIVDTLRDLAGALESAERRLTDDIPDDLGGPDEPGEEDG